MSTPAPRRAVLLGRVSTTDKGQDADTQLAALREAAARQGWIVVEEIALKLSAWTDKEAAEVKRRVLAPIIAGKADTLMVWALDRATRRGIAAALAFLHELENHLGGAFYSLQEPFLSTAANNGAARELILSLLAWVAEQESVRRSERIRAKAQASRAAAAKLGARARWGPGHLPSLADVERIRVLRAQGRSIREIAAATGIPKSTVARALQALAG
jgi:DNA invertase Pin-like site-specific DNA recombinase